ncbi:phosphatase PAP2 family protein [Pseudonocardia abyssalis]|uniref:Phosphatase PAP2 family protein n=1 Tax=Pseudonocardia abyssalis TaxID=2792008 RepID=A0ABS6ULS9_9PSEU|nr:phosphatase PAP2 family protein [Pseudonocardia abyssalis]MBW0117743.1 phosphatase PAP2 family protein [Pseudonocardia abyssalis]MBW0133206.1 phosphatase PAP2 family protein [Pseudonocardia abyssalis]
MTPRPDILAPAGSATVLVLAAASVTDDVVERNGITGIDQPVLDWFVMHRGPVESVAATVITNLGGTLAMTVLAAVVALWAVSRRHWGRLAFLLAATGTAGALVMAIKALVGRVRPPQSVQLVAETTASFPSGHTLGSAVVILTVAGVLLKGTRSAGVRATTVVAAVSAVLMIGLSRLYLGVHWATDVLAGWLLGGAVVAGLVAVAALHRTYRVAGPRRPWSGPAPFPPTAVDGAVA